MARLRSFLAMTLSPKLTEISGDVIMAQLPALTKVSFCGRLLLQSGNDLTAYEVALAQEVLLRKTRASMLHKSHLLFYAGIERRTRK